MALAVWLLNEVFALCFCGFLLVLLRPVVYGPPAFFLRRHLGYGQREGPTGPLLTIPRDTKMVTWTEFAFEIARVRHKAPFMVAGRYGYLLADAAHAFTFESKRFHESFASRACSFAPRLTPMHYSAKKISYWLCCACSSGSSSHVRASLSTQAGKAPVKPRSSRARVGRNCIQRLYLQWRIP